MADAPALLVYLESIEYTRLCDDIGPDLNLTAWMDAQPPVHVARKHRYGETQAACKLLGALPIDATAVRVSAELEETDTRPELDDRGNAVAELPVPEAVRSGARASAGGVVWIELWGIGGDHGENAVVGLHLLFVRAEDGISAVFAMNEDGSPRAEGAPLRVGDAVRVSRAAGPGQRAQRLVVQPSAGVTLDIGEEERAGDRVERRVRVTHAVGEGRVEANLGPDPALRIPVEGYAAPTRCVISAFGTLWDPRRPVAERQAAFQAGMRLAEAARQHLHIVGDEGLKLRRQTDLEGLTRYVLIADVAGDALGPLAGLEAGDATVIGDERAFVISVG